MCHPIVACARGWIGTRFHHQGRLKKTDAHAGGVDCLGLLVGVAAELGLAQGDGVKLACFDQRDYSHQPDSAYLRKQLSALLREIPVGDMRAGDMVLLRIDNSPQHLAIVSDTRDGLGIIHAYAPVRAVVEHALDAWWQQRIEAAFRIL